MGQVWLWTHLHPSKPPQKKGKTHKSPQENPSVSTCISDTLKFSLSFSISVLHYFGFFLPFQSVLSVNCFLPPIFL